MLQSTYIHVRWRQLAVPDQHHGDDVQRGLVQAFAQHFDQLVGNFWAW